MCGSRLSYGELLARLIYVLRLQADASARREDRTDCIFTRSADLMVSRPPSQPSTPWQFAQSGDAAYIIIGDLRIILVVDQPVAGFIRGGAPEACTSAVDGMLEDPARGARYTTGT